MKTVIIGDTHGRDYWRKVRNVENPDRFVFVGDYFDSYNLSATVQIHNFKEILDYKDNSKDEVILLVGNHDFHYMPACEGGKYSGWQASYSFEIGCLLRDRIDDIQAAYLLNDKFLITHAGVTNTWIKNNLFAPYYSGRIDEKINMCFRYQPQKFNFNGNDPYGDDITQSPIWVRPQSLYEDFYKSDHEDYYLDYYQIVGHTGVEKINHPKGDSKAYFIDTLDKSMDYLVIDDKNNIEIKSLK